jgi:hypothetical protein
MGDAGVVESQPASRAVAAGDRLKLGEGLDVQIDDLAFLVLHVRGIGDYEVLGVEREGCRSSEMSVSSLVVS